MKQETSLILDPKDKKIAELEAENLLWKVVSEIEQMERTNSTTSTKRSRTNDRTLVIIKALQHSEVPSDPRSVFAALRALAQSKNPPSPLLGFDADEKALKWEGEPDGPPAYQSQKDALAAIKRYLKKSR
ncbi:MAG: hypothetical protein V4463_14480 [Pseudomonadota bacterium]